MYLFRIFHSFSPLRNPIGFGASDFVFLAVALLLAGLLVAKAWLGPYLRQIAERTPWCIGLLFVLPIILRIMLLPQSSVPIPSGADDFSYILLGDTLRHFRLANAPHPLHQFFEAVFILQEPAYASIFPLGQGLVLTLGWAGVLISSGAFCALCYWMLRAWVPPTWALAGGLLAVLQFGPLNPWVNSYWGGLVSACAGCLVFGSLPRLKDTSQTRHGALLGLGLALQILSRPFEASFLFTAVVFYLVFSRRFALRPLITALAVVGAALVLMLLQNKAVTKRWTTMPYMLSRYQYGVPTTLTFQSSPVPHRQLTAEQELDYKAQAAIHGPATKSLAEYLRKLGDRFRYLRFFLLPPLYFAVLVSILSLRQRRYAWAAGTILLFALGSNFYPYFFPHYLAAVACLFVLFSVQGLSVLGVRARSYVALLSGASFVFWFGLHLFGDNDLLAVSAYQSWNYLNSGDPQGRAAVTDELAHAPGQQLVFVRYSPSHRFEEWIHNAAEIDSAQTVWADDLGTEENGKLIDYYPKRKAWLLEPDAHPPSLTPYATEPGGFLTVH
jgi:hypothetical protein